MKESLELKGPAKRTNAKNNIHERYAKPDIVTATITIGITVYQIQHSKISFSKLGDGKIHIDHFLEYNDGADWGRYYKEYDSSVKLNKDTCNFNTVIDNFEYWNESEKLIEKVAATFEVQFTQRGFNKLVKFLA